MHDNLNNCDFVKHGKRAENRDVRYLLFWPVFGLRYLLLENCNPAKVYHLVHCAMDDRIPFLEGFVIPYFLWHFCIIGMHLWLYRWDRKTYRQYSQYLLVTMGISTAVFLLYPTCQNLRPKHFPRDNFLTDVVRLLYRLDTSTNVCPSEHVIGSVGFFLAAKHSEKLGTPKRLPWLALTAFLTAVATVFLKQHSMVDVTAALAVCAIGWLVGFHGDFCYEKEKTQSIRHRIPFGRFSA